MITGPGGFFQVLAAPYVITGVAGFGTFNPGQPRLALFVSVGTSKTASKKLYWWLSVHVTGELKLMPVITLLLGYGEEVNTSVAAIMTKTTTAKK